MPLVLRVADMNAETIRQWINRQPFEPFVFWLSNGERYPVRHPQVVAIGRARIAIVDPETDRFVHVALVHIDSIEALQPA